MLRHYEDKMVRGYEDKYVLVASGPSLTQEQVDYCRGRAKVIVVNDNYLKAPWADYLYFADRKWLEWHKDRPEFKAFKGQKVTQFHTETCKKEIAEDCKKYNIKMIESVEAKGLSESPELLHQGSNSGYQAINLAYHLGANKVILLGYDMQLNGDQAHWFGDHPDKIRSSYDSFRKKYNTLAENMPKGLDIINCTQKTALSCFPVKKLEEVL